MTELAKAFSRFIMRDVVFILGGGSLIISFLYAFGYLDYIIGLNPIFYIYGAGIAYAIGYAIQDGVSLSGVTTTAVDPFPMPGIVQNLYRRLTKKQWQEVALQEYDHTDLMMSMPMDILERINPSFERMVSLKQIGTTMGPCFIISAILIFLRLYIRQGFFQNEKMFAGVLAGGIFFLGILLILLGWLKTAQQLTFMAKLNSLTKHLWKTK